MNEENIEREELNTIELIYQEIRDTRKELNEQIDNIKDTLVIEIAKELRSIVETTQCLANRLERKIDDEINDRKVDVSKVKDFNRIILNDIGSRVSILEEENEKYNLK